MKRDGTYKHIFHKGSGPGESNNPVGKTFNDGHDPSGIYGPNHAPGLYIAPNSNTLVVVMNTFKKIQERVKINDIPLNKW